MTTQKKKDPLEQIQEMIDTSISRHFGERDQREVEQKDPWKRLEGMIDRAVSKHFEAFASSLDEAEGEGGGAGGGGDDKAGGRSKEPSFFEQLGLV